MPDSVSQDDFLGRLCRAEAFRYPPPFTAVSAAWAAFGTTPKGSIRINNKKKAVTHLFSDDDDRPSSDMQGPGCPRTDLEAADPPAVLDLPAFVWHYRPWRQMLWLLPFAETVSVRPWAFSDLRALPLFAWRRSCAALPLLSSAAPVSAPQKRQ